MPKRILIDASHTEETRVVVLENGRVEEFESETAIKEQLKGNIYLAKITRVEPSLQAAFVDYGGDRHGFLPFSEIHPDNYNIPVADREELLASIRKMQEPEDDEDELGDANSDDSAESRGKSTASYNGSDDGIEANDTASLEVDVIPNEEEDIRQERAEDVNLYRKYKIQEVIKRGQIILVQVEKEERGNKGASLTTFISLAGRYCVLMPKALRRGGVSRRIGSYEDRKRLKQIIQQLQVPDETGLIVRTAGASKSSEEIQLDYDYLVNLWNHIREQTLESKAPALIQVEGDIVKRILRDWYNEQVDELLIEGDEAYQRARAFIKEVMPDQASRIKHYRNKVPILTRYRVEEQISMLFSQQVPLESGGSIVIMPTEALISIDVNSGKLTNTRNIEDTATSTNLEAAREIARQLRLRNLSGLIVVDFIDMMELKNKKAIERELKQAFAGDRSKIQIGRISTFGLLEMSRQRLSPSFLEVNSIACPSCKGVGFIKAEGSTAANVLRALESEINRNQGCTEIEVAVSPDVAVYILNHKRDRISALEQNYKVKVMLRADTQMDVDGFVIDKTRLVPTEARNLRDNVRESTRDNTRDMRNQNQAVDDDQEDEFNDRKDKGRQRRRGKGTVKQAPNVSQQVNDDLTTKAIKPKTGMFEGLWQKILD